MTSQQKSMLAILSVVAIFILGALGCITIYLLFFGPPSKATPAPEVVAQQTTAIPEATPSPTSGPTLPPTNTPTATPQPSPTGTKVVIVTVLPSPTPTVANCIDDINGFGASGVILDEEVQQYLLNTIPLDHLNHCREINYMAIDARAHSTPIAGNIIPVYREIYVYSTSSEQQNVEFLLDTLIHEIGHNVHYNIRRSNFDLDVQWAELHRQSEDMFLRDGAGFVSNYARTNKFEDFAESYMVYVRVPNMLLFLNPDKYEYMKTVIFEGYEYHR